MRTVLLWALAAATVILVAFAAGYGVYPLLHGAGRVQAAMGASPEISSEGERELGVFWQAWDLLDGVYYGDRPSDEERMREAVRGMVESFGDPYTVYLDPQPRELERDRLRGSFGGVGATIELTNTVFVLHPLPGQPAERAGVQDGDMLRAVDGVTVTTEMDTDDVVLLVRGDVGTTVTLAVTRTVVITATADVTGSENISENVSENVSDIVTDSASSGAGQSAGEVQLLEIPVVRAEIQTPSIEARLLEEYPGVASLRDAAGGAIGYMHLNIFSERSGAEVQEAVSDLVAEGATRFILDLRGNPGGLVDAAVAVADVWLDEGAVLIEENANGSSRTFSATQGGEGSGYPLVVVVDGGSASASEIVAGALQDAGRARLVGEQTFGKGSVQLIYELADASSLHITNAQWFTPKRRQISGNGLAPDIAVEAGVDPLPAAIQALLAE